MQAGPKYWNPQELNRYSYALNNPLRYIDPSGNQVEAPTITWDFGWGPIGVNTTVLSSTDDGTKDLVNNTPGLKDALLAAVAGSSDSAELSAALGLPPSTVAAVAPVYTPPTSSATPALPSSIPMPVGNTGPNPCSYCVENRTTGNEMAQAGDKALQVAGWTAIAGGAGLLAEYGFEVTGGWVVGGPGGAAMVALNRLPVAFSGYALIANGIRILSRGDIRLPPLPPPPPKVRL